MKRIAVVLGVAAVATFTGCKDPDYVGRNGKTPQEEPKSIATEPVQPETKKCQCMPGVKHFEPCNCGDPECKCVVEPAPKAEVKTIETSPVETKPAEVKPIETKPAEVKPIEVKPAEPEYTVYIVQNGDYLAKISKKYNITIDSIKKLNGLKDDKIMVGQKLKLPGKVEVGTQTVPENAIAKPAKKVYQPYAGATKEYVVKSGDTLGGIAYSNGISVRQLKELNGLSKDSILIGQKLKVPSEKVVQATKAAVAAKPAEKVAKAAEKPVVKPVAETKPVEKPAEVAPAAPVVEPVAPAPAVVTEPPSAPTMTYVVQEGEDLTRLSVEFGVSPAVIRELNNLGETDEIKRGQVLQLPAEAQQ